MIILLSAIGVASVLASNEFMLKRASTNGQGVDEEHYLLVQPLGRKKLFGEPTWNTVRGTPLRWQYQNNKIQLMGAFKKKNLCLYWKGNESNPFTIKNCNGMFGDTESMQIGCLGGSIGKFQNSVNQANEDPDKMLAGYSDQDDGSICLVAGKDVIPTNDFSAIMWYGAQAAEDKAKLFNLQKEIGGEDYFFAVREKPHMLDDAKEGNSKVNMFEWERHVTKDADNAAWFMWNGKQLEVVYPENARIDGKPLCLEMGKTGKMGDFPYKVQKCDRTVDRGSFGCSTENTSLFGMAWNAKRYDEYVQSGDAAKEAFHLDKLDELTYDGNSICDMQS